MKPFSVRFRYMAMLFALALLPTQATAIEGGYQMTAEDPVSKGTGLLAIYDSQHEIHLCTVVLIAQDIALTAAHCFMGMPGNIDKFDKYIVFGSVQTLGNIPSRGIKLEEGDYVLMPNYIAGQIIEDLAVIHLRQKLPAGVKPLKIGTAPQGVGEGNDVVIAGFGAENPGNSALLLTATNSRAVEFFNRRGAVGVASAPDKPHATHGDSGGPAVVVRAGVPYVYGIFSFYSEGQRSGIVAYSNIEYYVIAVNDIAHSFGSTAHFVDTRRDAVQH